MTRSIRITCAVAFIALSPLLAAATAKKSALPKASDVLEKAVVAMGGPAAVDAVKTLQLHGESKRFLPNGEDWSLTTSSYYVFPDRYRQEATLPIGGTLITMVGPGGAFLQTAGTGGVQLPDEEKAEILRSIRRNPLMILQRRKSVKATVQPEELIGGKSAHVVRLDEEIGPTTLAFDAKSGNILRISYSTVAGMDKSHAELTISYSDYRPAGSVRFPYASSATIAGKPAFAFQADKVAINGPLDDKIFTPATVEPAGAPGVPAAAPSPAPMPGMSMPAPATTTAPPKPPQPR